MSLGQKTDIREKYTLGDVIGTGNFAEVRKGVCKSTGEEVAIKVIEPQNLEDEQGIKMEVELLAQLEHPNIIRMIEVFDSPAHQGKPRKIFIVMELVTGGELFDRMIKKQTFQESEARAVVRTVVETLKYMHERGVVHRDLKPENILFATEADDSPIKVADFGLAKLYDPGAAGALKTLCGSPGYVAPEVLRPKDKKKGYDPQVDMWSTGVILYTLLCGFSPFWEEDQGKLFRQIVKGNYDFPSPEWDDISEQAKDLVKKCLHTDPAMRITPDQALAHPWMVADSAALGTNIDAANLRRYIRKQKFARVKNAVLAIGRMQRALQK